MTITAEQLEAIALKAKSVTTEAGSVTQRDASDLIEVIGLANGAEAVDGTNVNGGPRSAWHCLRPARAQLPGAR